MGGGGSDYPVFRGASVQYGGGIGDIFRSIGRFLLPVFASSARTFVESTAKGLGEGQSLKDAAQGALSPTLATTASQATSAITRKLSGRGRKKKRMSQRGGKRKSQKRVYKGAGKRKSKRKTHRKKSAKRFCPSNF